MDLKMFLDPVGEEVIDEALPVNSLQQAFFINKDIIYDLDGIDIAILGLREHRGCTAGFGTSDAADTIRKKLYRLTKTTGKNRILDLGNLRNGPTRDETCKRIQAVVQHLLEQNICVILIGGTHDLDMGQFLGYQELNKLVTFLNVDARFDLESEGEPHQQHIANIFKYDPNYLFSYIHLAYQSYFVDTTQTGIMEKLNFDAYRLGEIRQNMKEMEPVMRDADLVSIDISAIQSIFCPGTMEPNIFGLTGEEACQLTWYAGLNEKLSSIGFYNYDPSADDEKQNTAMVIATMIWYFITGYYNRKGEQNFASNDYLVYEVHMEKAPGSIKFYKSKKSEKWWMELPDLENESGFIRHTMLPCSYADYQQAQEGEYPQRWLNALTRFS